MKETFAVALLLALAACGGDKPKLALAADSTTKTIAAAPMPVAAEALKPDADKELAKRVARAIDGAKLHGVDVVAADGVVTLWGATPTARQRDRAGRVAAKVQGVQAVENKLEVVSGS
jgi:BON domain